MTETQPTIAFIQDEFNEGRAQLSYIGVLLDALEVEKNISARLSSRGFQGLHLENEQLKDKLTEADLEVASIDKDFWQLHAEMNTARVRISALKDCIMWTLGEHGEFQRRSRTNRGNLGKRTGIHYWRPELRKRLQKALTKEYRTT